MNYLDLPVYKHKDLILGALKESQAVVVESPTGSGKTTQIPVILRDAGFGKTGIIGVTQPRRIAAVSVSEFIARQLGGEKPVVGYKMRFEDRTRWDTEIKIMTDGILLQEMKLDPWLSKYSCLLVDEAHERSLNIDFILGLLKRVLEARGDFKVIVSSATINAGVFSEYFGECPVVKIDAVTYPVTLIYDPPLLETGVQAGSQLAAEALIGKIASIAERVVSEKREGDLLIFLPGEKMIKDCMSRLAFGPAGKDLYILPLYGRLGKEEQERVFDKAPAGKTKAVISTNIAETSVTIDGITTVIDSGLSKLNYYSPRTFTSSLIEAPISKASANQRRGRAGRTREGTCYRLYTRRDFENRVLFTTEEIYRTDLSEVVLRMADLGISAFEEFDFISPPNREGLIAAIETLNLLDALESDRTLSPTGKLMTEFPLSPRQSRIIVEAILRYPNVVEETIIAAAFLSTQSPYLLPPGEEMEARKAHHAFRDPGGDFVSYLKLYRAYMASLNKEKFCEKSYLDERAMAEIANVVFQLEEIVSALKVPVLKGGPQEDYICCVARGLIQFVCVREGGNGRGGSFDRYRSLTADRILIHPGSVMFRRGPGEPGPRFIVAGEIVQTTRMYAMSVSPISYSSIQKIGGELFSSFKQDDRKRGGRDTAEGKLKHPRDFTNNIRIAGEVFAIETVKGKKEVKLPWERLRLIKDTINPDSASLYRQLKGIITLGEYTLLAGEKLSLILKILPSLNLDGVLDKKPPSRANLVSGDNPDRLLESLPSLVKVSLCSAGGRKGKESRGKKDLGFITLFTNGAGDYWLKVLRGFHTSLNESIGSLEALIDELGDEVDIEKKHIVNQTYRRLSDLLE
ncbi:MAG: ATP-dependent RNA helicase [Spirochaetaceae bacterium]|jgi:HrpA-like RNA helicase|nr:ATP-dependent RNA helicase [Spirochaetaceae bacterium]